MAVLNLLASPFMLLFLLIYFFMKNAERFYHHPSTLGELAAAMCAARPCGWCVPMLLGAGCACMCFAVSVCCGR